MKLIDRFMQKVETGSGCWVWTARKTPQGYGRFFLHGTNRLAHRVSYELFNGLIGELHVLHRCDNPSCVNPTHLWLGTNEQNVADKISKGREPSHVGEQNNRSKLTEGDVMEIRDAVRRGESQRRIAGKFSIAQAHVSAIARKKAWRHV